MSDHEFETGDSKEVAGAEDASTSDISNTSQNLDAAPRLALEDVFQYIGEADFKSTEGALPDEEVKEIMDDRTWVSAYKNLGQLEWADKDVTGTGHIRLPLDNIQLSTKQKVLDEYEFGRFSHMRKRKRERKILKKRQKEEAIRKEREDAKLEAKQAMLDAGF